MVGVTDADNVSATNPTGAITGALHYTWQFQPLGINRPFRDIVDLNGLPVGTPTFTVTAALEGLALRVRVTYMDAHGVLEAAFSTPTAPAAAGTVLPPASLVVDQAYVSSPGVHFIREDLQFF